MLWRASTIACYALINLQLTTCRSNSVGESPSAPEQTTQAASQASAPPEASGPAVDVGPLPGVDSSGLTAQERQKFGTYVSELLAPCPDQPVTLAVCIRDNRPCGDCVPAANFLVGRVRRGDTRELAEAAFRARFSAGAVKSVEVGNAPWKGASNPAVVLVEWADFECPFCRVTSPVLEQMLKEFPGEIKFVFKNYPLPSHVNGEAAARAALAARKQGKFWKMHEALFAPAQKLDQESLVELAGNIGLDVARFKRDLESEELKAELKADKEQAQQLGLRGTPFIFINGREFNLEQFDLAEDLVPWIELEIERSKGKAAPAPKSGNSQPG